MSSKEINGSSGGNEQEHVGQEGESSSEAAQDNCQAPDSSLASQPVTEGSEQREDDGFSSAICQALHSVLTSQPVAESGSTGSAEGQLSPESNDGVIGFPRRRLSVGRQYRRRSGVDDSSDDENMAPSTRESSSDPDFPTRWEDLLPSGSSSDSDRSSHSLDERRRQVLEETAPTPKVLLKPKPSHKWFAVREIMNREAGCSPRLQSNERFQHHFYGSLHAVQRLELMYKLEHHRGCVNSLHFNRSGELLISASDDKRVVLWNWGVGKPILSYDSGHTGNVFQAKFLPLSGDCHIVTCARDGQVRLSVLSGVGVCKGTRLLAQHKRPTHKLAIHQDTPHVFLSAGEDAMVLSHDVRTSKASRILFVKENSSKVGLYSIHSNPVYSNEFIVTGEDHFIRLYDKRKISQNHSVPLKKFCPKHLLHPDVFLHVTCAVFNYNGTEVIGSYNDDDIYLFDTRLSDDADYVHKYEGHRNSITVKGVNFFGPKSEYIVSGSDCGNIFFWDKSTESVVQWMRGDEEGVVNSLEPHPQVPIIATSGLDSDIKIWIPSYEKEPILKGLKSTVINNQADRHQNAGQRSDPFDNRQMRWLWRQIQRFEQRRNPDSAARAEGRVGQGQPDQRRSDHSSSSSEEDANSAPPQCSPS